MTNVKKKRISKKSKLSWRKHVNISDVESFLEDQRLEERLGKPVSEKTNDELFQVDVIPTQLKISSKEQRRKMLLEKQPKCYSVLQPHSEVPDPLIKRNRTKTKYERKNELLKKKEKDMKSRGILKAKELQSLKDRKNYEIKRANRPKRGDITTDIWNIKSLSDKVSSDEWIENNTRRHTLRGIGKLSKKIPKSVVSKRSVVPAIEHPHPGTSYNPTFEDHRNLLQEVVTKETKIIKKEDHLLRVTRGMFNKVSSTERDHNWLKEMSESLPINKDHEERGIEDGDYKSINPPVKNKKKDLKQRRKQKEELQFQLSKISEKQQKKKIADIYKLRFLKQAIEKDEKKMELLRSKRLKKKESKAKEPKRLGALKFEEEEIHFNEPKDIAGNLRNVKKEGNLLLHRFKSMQKRNILPPTTRRTSKKAKIKRFKKPGHKDDWKITVARPKNV